MSSIVENALLIYTDGSLKYKGRHGGYGIKFIDVDALGCETEIDTFLPTGFTGTTNNRMELMAVVAALRQIPKLPGLIDRPQVVIRTDSKYVVNGYESAPYWAKNGWRTSRGPPVLNIDLWKDLLREAGKLRIRLRIEWVRGHDKDEHNIHVDKLANQSAIGALKRREFRGSVRRKMAPGRTKTGSVRITGQTMIVYVVEAQPQRKHDEWRLRYQVASKDHPDYRAIDWIYSKELLPDGHYFEVRVNEDPRYPQVVEKVREVPKEEMTTLPATDAHARSE